MKPNYNIEEIKFSVEKPTFDKAVKIYNSGGVVDFNAHRFGYQAKVRGSQANYYSVSVSNKSIERGDCDCYMGQNDYLCKHMVALAIMAAIGGKSLKENDEEYIDLPIYSGKLGELTAEEIKEIKSKITQAMKYISPYRGPSKYWFQYQSNLSQGCNRLATIVSGLPASRQTAEVLIDLLLRLDRKMAGGVDDSDGTVGNFMYELASLLKKFTEQDSSCIKPLEKLCDRESMFEWDEQLIKIVDEHN